MTKRIDRRGFVASTLATAAAATVGTMTTLVPMHTAQAAVPEHEGAQPDAFPYAELSVAELQSQGHAGAAIYDPQGVGGTHVMYVLKHADKPELERKAFLHHPRRWRPRVRRPAVHGPRCRGREGQPCAKSPARWT
mgnify:CR=1 FL=1